MTTPPPSRTLPRDPAMNDPAAPAGRRRSSRRGVALVVAIVLVAIFGRLWSGGYLDRDPIWRFPAQGQPAGASVLLFSGDAGLRGGLSRFMALQFAASGVETVAVSTPTVFRTRKDRSQLDAIVANAVRQAAQTAGTRRLYVIGQSYGADILQTGLAHLPAELRRKIAGVVLIVPGTGTYFRADPLALLYRTTADSASITTIPTIDWTPVTCIYGVEEDDSVCPLLKMRNARLIGLPGGHYFNHDKERVSAIVWRAIGAPQRTVR